jgi:hypothetical protein
MSIETRIIRHAGIFLLALSGSFWARGDSLPDAIRAKDWTKVEALIQAQPELLSSQPGLLPMAAEANRPEVVAWLLDHHADVNATDIFGMSALHQAVINGHADIAKLLLDRGADVNAVDRTGLTPLHQAAQMGRAAIAELLLAHHADVNAQGTRSFWLGQTPLYFAAHNGSAAVVKVLLAHGADLTATDKNGLTALQIAQKNHHADVVALLQNPAKATADEGPPPAPVDGVPPAEVISKLMVAVAQKPPGPVENEVTAETIDTFKGLAQMTDDQRSPRDAIVAGYDGFTIAETPANMYAKGKAAIYFCRAKLTPAAMAEYKKNPPGEASTWQVTDGNKTGPKQTGPSVEFIPGDCDFVDAAVPPNGQVYASFCLVQEHGSWKVHCVYLSDEPLSGSNYDFVVRALAEFAAKL